MISRANYNGIESVEDSGGGRCYILFVIDELRMIAKQNKNNYNTLNSQQKKILLNEVISRILVVNEARKQKLDQRPATKLKFKTLVDSVLAATLINDYTNNDAWIVLLYNQVFLRLWYLVVLK